MRTIYYKSNLFDQAGMASLLPPDPPPVVPKQDKRTLPPDIRQEIVNLHAEYPAFRPHELTTICFVKFGRKPSPQTIKLILASGPKPSRERRFQRFAEIADSFEGSVLRKRVHSRKVEKYGAVFVRDGLIDEKLRKENALCGMS